MARSPLKSLSRLIQQNSAALQGVTDNLLRQTRTVTGFTNAITKAEKSQLQSLKLGTTYNKFLKDNTEALKDSKIGFAETAKALLDNFDQGIRVNSGNVMKLTQRMIATGQDTQALNNLNSQLIALTGRNNDVLENVNDTNMDISDKYQISNIRLIETLNKMTEVLDSASFFGAESVEGVSNLVQELQGRVGVGMAGQINTTLQALMPGLEALGRGGLLGSEQLTKDLADGTAKMADMVPVFQQLLSARDEALRGGANPNVALQQVAAQFNLSERQLKAMLQLGTNVIEGVKKEDEARLKEEERFQSLRTAQQKANDFFDTMAPAMYGQLVLIAEGAIRGAQLANLGGLAGGAAGPMRGKGGLRLGRAGLAGTLALGAMAVPGLMSSNGGAGGSTSTGGTNFGGIAAGAAQGAMMGMVAGPVGAAIGGLIGGGLAYFQQTADSTAETAEATKELAEEEKRKKRQERQKELERQNNAMAALTAYVRSRSLKDLSSEQALELQARTVRVLSNIDRKTEERRRVSTPGGS
jgi:hypothetical protein